MHAGNHASFQTINGGEKNMKRINPIESPYQYKLHIKLGKILATQNADFDKRTLREKLGFDEVKTTEYKQAAVEEPQDKVKLPVQKRKNQKKRKDQDLVLTHCFQRNNGNIYEPLGGAFGHIKRTLRQAVKTIGLARYKEPAIELLKFKPELVNLGNDKNITLTSVLEPRSRGKTRELVYYETATDREIDVVMSVSKTCPLTGKEISAVLTAIKDYDGFGASKRGIIESIEILN